MADSEASSADRGGQDEVLDERLDFFSPKFDPLLALNTPGIKPPVEDAKTFDNLSGYKSHYELKLGVVGSGAKVKKDEGDDNVIKRRWKEHQMPIKVDPKVRNERNIFLRMAVVQGPLAALRKCKDEKLRIKIVTRNDRGVRGYLLARIVAFDKHWNLALEEIEETWVRRKKKKVPPFEGMPKRIQGSRNKVKLPEVKIVEEDAKTETCTRRVNQMLLRGENVVTVQICKEG